MTISIKQNASQTERSRRAWLRSSLSETPIPDDELLENLPLYLNRQTLTLVLHMNDLYQRILNTPGIIMEFGVRWGRNTALLQNLRGIYEPYNHTRRIVSFDTFEGFPSVSEQDGSDSIAQAGAYSVTKQYASYLTEIVDHHEHESPISHINKTELVAGDATQTLPLWLERHQETLIAMAYFDFDLYDPTRVCINAIIPRLTQGSLLVFDQLNYGTFPGETMALRNTLSTHKIRLQRSPFAAHQAYCVWGQ